MKPTITTFVISLRESAARREAMTRRLAELQLEAEFFEACDGKTLPASTLPESLRQSGLSGGEIGCYLSHFRLWKTVADRGLPFALVLEDDVRLDAALVPVCRALENCRLPFDMVRLSALSKIQGKTVLQLPGGHRLVLPVKSPSGTQGYLVSLAGARRLIRTLDAPSLPIDCELNLYWRHELRVLLVAPPVVFHDEGFPSDIASTGRTRIDTSLGLMQRLSRSYEKRRALQRIFHALKG